MSNQGSEYKEFEKFFKVFETGNIEGISDICLCAIGLGAWGFVKSGVSPPESFGDAIAKIALKLGISGTSDSFMEWSNENFKE